MNNNIKIIGIIIVVSLLSIACNQPPEWVNFQSKEGRFKIEFPHTPVDTTKIVKNKHGNLILHYYIYNAADNDYRDSNLLYYVSYIDYPEVVADSNHNEWRTQLFKEETESIVSSLRGKLEKVTTESIKNYPGQEAKITFNFRDVHIIRRQKCFLVKNRVYSIVVHTAARKDSNKSIDHFLNTFELL